MHTRMPSALSERWLCSLAPSLLGWWLADVSCIRVRTPRYREIPETLRSRQRNQGDRAPRGARIALTGPNRTVPSSLKAAFLHEQIRAFETRRPLASRGDGSPTGPRSPL